MSHEMNDENVGNYWEIIDENPYLDEYLEHVREAEEQLNDPECDEDTARDILIGLQNEWKYNGSIAVLTGKIRPYDDSYEMPDAESEPDRLGRYAFVDSEDPTNKLRFIGIEAVSDSNERFRVVFTVGDGMSSSTEPQYLVAPDDVMRWDFVTVLPEVRSHILHRLEPALMHDIDEMIAQSLDSPDGLRKLSLAISSSKYGDYDIIQEIEAYINHTAEYDRDFPSILTLQGMVMDEEGNTGTIHTPSDIRATLGTLSLITTQEVGQPPYQRVVVTADVPHPIPGQDNEELTFLLEYLKAVRTLRPSTSALGRLAAGESIDVQVMKPLEIAENIDTPYEAAEDKYSQRRYVQNCIDHLIQYTQASASARCNDEEAAKALAHTCQEKCEEIIGQELLGYTFVVEGTGVESSQYIKNGSAAPGDIHFELESAPPVSPDLFADCQYVVFQGLSVDIREGEDGFRVVPLLSARLVNYSDSYHLLNPVTSQLAAVVTKYDFCTVRLDGSAEITEIHLYDRKKFAEAMERFSRKLIDAPDLKPVYEKLLEIEDQFITEDDELQPFMIEPFQQIGELCGGDELACTLATDALSALFGNERIVKLNGRGRDTKTNTAHEFDNLVKISSVIATHHSVNVNEPMFAFEVVDDVDLSAAVHLLPLRDLASIAI